MKNQKMKKAPIVFGTALGLAVVSGTLFTFANNGANISLEQAKAIALQDAQVTAEQVTFVKERKETDNGRAVYDIEFYSGNREFDYEIDARSGAITEKDFDIEHFNAQALQNGAQSQAFVGEAEAKRIALADAGLNEADVTFLTVKLDTDNGRNEYDIEFYAGGKEYDYEIDAVSGAINERDWDVEHYAAPAPQAAQATFIGEAEAKRIALADAGLSEANVTFLMVKLDTDDGRNEYDIEFYAGGTEYDYEIDAVSGAINERDWDVEHYAAPASQATTAPAPQAAPAASAPQQSQWTPAPRTAPAAGYYYDYDDDDYDDDDRYDDDRYDDDDDDRYDDDDRR